MSHAAALAPALVFDATARKPCAQHAGRPTNSRGIQFRHNPGDRYLAFSVRQIKLTIRK